MYIQRVCNNAIGKVLTHERYRVYVEWKNGQREWIRASDFIMVSVEEYDQLRGEQVQDASK